MAPHPHTPELAEPVALEQLAQQAQRGAAEAFDELARRMRGPLHRFLVGRLASPADADDVAQETLLRAFENIDRYDPARPFQTWLFTIGSRLAINHGQSAARRKELSAQPDHEPSVQPAEAQGVWRLARERLAAEPYRALWLRYARGYSVAEVERELGRSAVSTKVMLYRARRRLLSELESS